jgi:hypothetical protein
VQRLILWIVRGSLVWGRWATRHPRIARLVYVSEYAALFALYWVLFGIWAGLIAAAVMVTLLNLLMAWARRGRRQRGLPPLPSLWRNRSS